MRVPVTGDETPAPRPLAALLHDRLRASSAPVIIVGDRTLPAGSLWTAARALVRDLRGLGLQPGDRLVVATTDDLLLAATLVAGLSSNICVAVLRTADTAAHDHAALHEHLSAVDARLVLRSTADAGTGEAPAWTATADLAGLTPEQPIVLREARHPATAEVALLVHTSGTTGHPTWVALSQTNLAAVLDSHLVALFGEAWNDTDPTSRPVGIMASTIPWAHAFGLVLDLLLGLVAAQVMLRDPAAGADPARLADLVMRAGPGAWLNAVPLTLERLGREHPDAAEVIASLGGGIVGGASCPAPVRDMATGSALRMGYGLTEAGPGVCLGEPGEFRPGLLGRPIGCRVHITDQRLVVTGPNVSVGVLGPTGALLRRGTDQLATEDTVREEGSLYVFTGRMGDTLKLANGRWLALGDVDADVLDATDLGCTAVADDDGNLTLVVDGVAGDVATVHRWLAALPHHWVPLVRRVVPLSAALWPRNAKGETRRHGPGGLLEVTADLPGFTDLTDLTDLTGAAR